MAAKKQEPKKEEAEAASAGAPNNKKLFIIFGVALVVAIGASVGGTMFLLGGKEEEHEEPEQVEAEPKVAVYHTFEPPFVINYQVAGKGRYLQTELSVFAHKASVVDAVKLHEPLLKARISEALAAQNFLDLQSRDGKKSLQKVLKKTVNDVLKKNKIEDEVEQVMFGSFVMQ